MNIKRLIPCFLLIGSLLLGSCENEQITDMEKQGTELPDGKYPLTFTAVQTAPIATPQTRVSENTDGMSSKWDGGEVIKVQIADGKAGTYTLDDTGKTTAQTPCYWQNTQAATINAWYSNITGQNTDDETVDLNNQQNGLAYVLKAVTTADYKTSNLELKFQHQLAKVRIKLTGDKANDVTNVHVNNYTSCTVTNGNVTGGSTGYIPMCKNGEYYEANVVPMKSITSDDFIRLNDETKAIINGISELEVGNVYTIIINVSKKVTEINGGENITKPGDYIMTGDISQGITLNGDNINLTLDGVTANIGNAIKVTGGSPTLIVKGTNNSFNGNGAGILISPNASVTIKGATDNASDSKLTIKAGSSNQPGIGCANESSCKNIIIKNVTLDVTGGSSSVDGGAAIGTAGEWGSSVNDILIENSIVTATGGKGAAAIGFGTIIDPNYSINSIKIINSQITAIVQYQSYQTNGYAAGIGFPYAAEISVLTIKQPIEITSTETDPARYFSSFKAMKDGNIVSETIRKVGKPMNSYSHSVFSWQGAKFNGQPLGTDVGY